MWKQVAYKTGVWLATEVWLNIIGLDNIADYCEFLFTQDSDLNLKNRRTVKINEYPPQFCPKIDNFCPLPGSATKPIDLQEDIYKAQAEIFNSKCKNLEKPCLKVICLSTDIKEVDRG